MRPQTDRKCHILLVDDHADTLSVLTRLLISRGYHAATATNVAEAIATSNESWPDVVVTDLDLPDGTGFDLIRELRARAPVRVVALTGHGLLEHRTQTRDAGFDAHLTKPVTFDQLDSVLRHCCGVVPN